MTSAISTPVIPRDTPDALDLALVQSHDVRDKVEECSDDLASKNQAIKQQISKGETSLPTRESLLEGERVETSKPQPEVDPSADGVGSGGSAASAPDPSADCE